MFEYRQEPEQMGWKDRWARFYRQLFSSSSTILLIAFLVAVLGTGMLVIVAPMVGLAKAQQSLGNTVSPLLWFSLVFVFDRIMMLPVFFAAERPWYTKYLSRPLQRAAASAAVFLILVLLLSGGAFIGLTVLLLIVLDSMYLAKKLKNIREMDKGNTRVRKKGGRLPIAQRFYYRVFFKPLILVCMSVVYVFIIHTITIDRTVLVSILGLGRIHVKPLLWVGLIILFLYTLAIALGVKYVRERYTEEG